MLSTAERSKILKQLDRFLDCCPSGRAVMRSLPHSWENETLSQLFQFLYVSAGVYLDGKHCIDTPRATCSYARICRQVGGWLSPGVLAIAQLA